MNSFGSLFEENNCYTFHVSKKKQLKLNFYIFYLCNKLSKTVDVIYLLNYTHNFLISSKYLLRTQDLFPDVRNVGPGITRDLLKKTCFNPFLFIRGLSRPSRVQTLLFQNCLKLDFLTLVFLYLVVTLALKNPRSSIGLEIRPQSAFTSFRALLPSAKNSAE